MNTRSLTHQNLKHLQYNKISINDGLKIGLRRGPKLPIGDVNVGSLLHVCRRRLATLAAKELSGLEFNREIMICQFTLCKSKTAF